MIKIKKTFKLISGLILFFLFAGLLIYGYLYFKYDEDLPIGNQGVEADALAQNMLDALNYKAFKNTAYIEWTFRNKNHYKWYKSEGICLVIWEEYKVSLNLQDFDQSQAFVHNFEVHNEQARDLIKIAIDQYNNDSFWLIAPYKIFEKGVERRLVKAAGGGADLLVTFTSGGTTPGDSYLWSLEKSGMPKQFKMWTSKVPFKGLEATWNDWTTTESGALLPTHHKVLFVTIDMGEVKGSK